MSLFLNDLLPGDDSRYFGRCPISKQNGCQNLGGVELRGINISV